MWNILQHRHKAMKCFMKFLVVVQFEVDLNIFSNDTDQYLHNHKADNNADDNRTMTIPSLTSLKTAWGKNTETQQEHKSSCKFAAKGETCVQGLTIRNTHVNKRPYRLSFKNYAHVKVFCVQTD